MTSPISSTQAPEGAASFRQFGKVLDSPIKVFALYALSMLILAIGLATLGAKYSDIDFASKYLWTEIVVSLLFVGVTTKMAHPNQIGLRLPRIGWSWRLWAPVAAVALVGVSTGLVWASLPEGASVDTTVWFRTFLTTMLVGFAEEWMYRGLLLVALTRLLGFRRGVLAAAVAFGLLHGLNILGGQSIGAVGGQVVLTTVIALMFTGVVLATRSLWVAMILHGLYDFFLFSNTLLIDAGASTSSLTNLAVFSMSIMAIAVLVSVLRSPDSADSEFYWSD